MTDITVEVVAAPAIEVTVTPAGAPGMSAYQHAVANGFVGTEAEWIESLHGEDGADSTVPGPPGPTAVSTDPGNAATLGSDDLIFVSASSGGGSDWGDIGGTLSDQTDLQAALDGKAATAHTHAQSDVTGLTAALAGKADTAHTHAQSDVTGLASALAGKSDTGHTHTASNITDFDAAADARVAAGIAGKLDTSAAPELIRDTMGTALVAGTNITLTVNDAGDTITVADTVSPIAAGSANNPHTTKTATRNSALPKNWWRYAGTSPADDPTNWLDGDEWITV